MRKPSPGALAVLFVMLAAVLLNYLSINGDQELAGDALTYVRIARNLSENRVFSIDDPDTHNPRPSAYRPPLYPAIVWSSLALESLIEKQSPPIDDKRRFASDLPVLIWIQHTMVIAVALIAMVVVRNLTRSWVIALLAFFLVALDRALAEYSDSVLSETTITFLLAMLAFVLQAFYRSRRYILLPLAGALIGAMALTRGVFEFFLPLAVAVLTVHLWSKEKSRRRAVAGLILLVTAYAVVVVPWKARNRSHFGRWYLTDRGGVILDIRAEYNMMTPHEYLATFLYWGRPSLAEGNLPQEHYRRLDRENPDGYYLTSRARRSALVKEFGSMTAADDIQKDIAVRKIVSNPLRHLALCLPFAYRGMLISPVHAILFVIFLLVFTFSLVRREGRLLMFFFPYIFLYAFQTAFTHNIPRYSVPIIPALYVSGAVLAAYIAGRVSPDPYTIKRLDK